MTIPCDMQPQVRGSAHLGKNTTASHPSWEDTLLLEHILECDTCLTVLVNFRLSTEECTNRCQQYRILAIGAQQASPVPRAPLREGALVS